MKKPFLLCALALAVLAGAASIPSGTESASADELTSISGLLLTTDISTLVVEDSTTGGDPAGSTTYGKFKLFGAAKDDLDPENPSNEVISFDTRTTDVAGAYRKLGDHVKVPQLDNQVEVKYLYVGRTCGGGSTRFQLGIDRDGDGKFDGNAFGYLGDKPFGGACPANQWTYEDMTNSAAKWDLSQFGGSMTTSWDAMEAFFTTLFPNHTVLNVVLVDDSGSFFPLDKGCAYFDLVSAGGRTLANHSDTDEKGAAPNAC